MFRAMHVIYCITDFCSGLSHTWQHQVPFLNNEGTLCYVGCPCRHIIKIPEYADIMYIVKCMRRKWAAWSSCAARSPLLQKWKCWNYIIIIIQGSQGRSRRKYTASYSNQHEKGLLAVYNHTHIKKSPDFIPTVLVSVTWAHLSLPCIPRHSNYQIVGIADSRSVCEREEFS